MVPRQSRRILLRREDPHSQLFTLMASSCSAGLWFHGCPHVRLWRGAAAWQRCSWFGVSSKPHLLEGRSRLPATWLHKREQNGAQCWSKPTANLKKVGLNLSFIIIILIISVQPAFPSFLTSAAWWWDVLLLIQWLFIEFVIPIITSQSAFGFGTNLQDRLKKSKAEKRTKKTNNKKAKNKNKARQLHYCPSCQLCWT